MEDTALKLSSTCVAVAGIDTISVAWSNADAARLLRSAAAAGGGLGPGERFPVRRGKRGAIVASVDGLTVGAYSAPSDMLFVEGRLALMFGEFDPHLLATFHDIRFLPSALARILRLAHLDDELEDWPLGLEPDDRPTSELSFDDIEVRRIDMAVDLRFDSNDPTGLRILDLAARARIPNRLTTAYSEEGRTSVSLSPAGSRAIIAPKRYGSSASPLAASPTTRMAGTSVMMPRKRATRPPSWSTLTMSGDVS